MGTSNRRASCSTATMRTPRSTIKSQLLNPFTIVISVQ
jgi:hypothetical protein